MIRLNKVYKIADLYDLWDEPHRFLQWLKKNFPDVYSVFNYRQSFKVKISYKVGKRRKLKSLRVWFRNEGCGDPQCCGDYYTMQIDRR